MIELADKIGVSRQAVSKWESEQSTPDIDKIILLSEYFETTTDYLLKGIEPAKESEKKWNAMLFSAAGTILNAIGLVAAIAIWIEQQMSCSVGIGLVIMLFGTGIFLAGQIVDSRGKEKARYSFILFPFWEIPSSPMGCTGLCISQCAARPLWSRQGKTLRNISRFLLTKTASQKSIKISDEAVFLPCCFSVLLSASFSVI